MIRKEVNHSLLLTPRKSPACCADAFIRKESNVDRLRFAHNLLPPFAFSLIPMKACKLCAVIISDCDEVRISEIPFDPEVQELNSDGVALGDPDGLGVVLVVGISIGVVG